MYLYSYVVKHDAGFAPNPFGGFLTLATCKPKIRLHARDNDWLVGTGASKAVGNNMIVYAAQITKVLTIEQYGSDVLYAIKTPSVRGPWWRKHGDNIYFYEGGRWHQRRNCHHTIENKDGDLSGKNVLICNRFWYFGEKAKELPARFSHMVKKGPGCKKFNVEDITDFINWLSRLEYGMKGKPDKSPGPKTNCGR